MTVIDARGLAQETVLDAGICIIGAGGAGITLARALGARGVDVLLVEGGDRRPDAATQALHDLTSVGYPVRQNYMSRTRQYGGTSNVWAGRNMRLVPLDFEKRDWVPGSGWPIPYGEVACWYPAAAQVLGLPTIDRSGADFHHGRLSEAEARLFAAERLAPTVSLWGRRSMRFARTYGPELRRTTNIRVLLNANATRIELDSAGTRVAAIHARTLADHRLTLRARTFVLAAGGIENARLLLVSNDRHAAGIGNAHDLVGRFFMEHPRAVFGRVRLRPGARLPLLRGVPLPDGKVQLGIALDETVQRREGLLNHHLTLESEVSGYTAQTYESAIGIAKVLLRRGHAGSRLALSGAAARSVPGFYYLLTPKELVPHWLFRWQRLARDALARPPGETWRVPVYFCEQPPDRESRVSLGTERDALGMPRIVLDWRVGEAVTRSVLRLQEILGEELVARGLGELEPGRPEELRFTDASHHMGTTRMAARPEEGVVDPDCRVHGLANLYVAGSSVFPSCGHANPTLTIVALALRLAERLAEA